MQSQSSKEPAKCQFIQKLLKMMKVSLIFTQIIIVTSRFDKLESKWQITNHFESKIILIKIDWQIFQTWKVIIISSSSIIILNISQSIDQGQLNTYGFHKICRNKNVLYFYNKLFFHGNQHNFHLIKRRQKDTLQRLQKQGIEKDDNMNNQSINPNLSNKKNSRNQSNLEETLEKRLINCLELETRNNIQNNYMRDNSQNNNNNSMNYNKPPFIQIPAVIKQFFSFKQRNSKTMCKTRKVMQSLNKNLTERKLKSIKTRVTDIKSMITSIQDIEKKMNIKMERYCQEYGNNGKQNEENNDNVKTQTIEDSEQRLIGTKSSKMIFNKPEDNPTMESLSRINQQHYLANNLNNFNKFSYEMKQFSFPVHKPNNSFSKLLNFTSNNNFSHVFPAKSLSNLNISPNSSFQSCSQFF